MFHSNLAKENNNSVFVYFINSIESVSMYDIWIYYRAFLFWVDFKCAVSGKSNVFNCISGRMIDTGVVNLFFKGPPLMPFRRSRAQKIHAYVC